MTLSDIIRHAINLEIDARGTSYHKECRHLRDVLETYRHEQDKITPDPEAEWVTLETDEASFGFQKCCDSFLDEIKQGRTFSCFEHPSNERPFIGTMATIGHWELHYCPYCGVKINLQYEIPF